MMRRRLRCRTFRRPLWDYCKQRFAQVTNPPIDSLRESHVMSLKVFLGRAAINSPLLDAGQLRLLQKELGATERIAFTFRAEDGVEAAKATLARHAGDHERQPRPILPASFC